jgi:hypothetical protein
MKALHQLSGRNAMNMLALAARTAPIILMSGGSEAATVSCATGGGGKGKSGAEFALTGALEAACFGGNDTNSIDAGFTLFGETGWTLVGKTDGGSWGDGPRFVAAPENGEKRGGWRIDAGDAPLGDLALTLKAGPGFAAFLLDPAQLSGEWRSGKDLSHASLYRRTRPDAPPAPAPIPLPAAGVLLASAVAATALVGRLRRRA